jgi:hypothetical protein
VVAINVGAIRRSTFTVVNPFVRIFVIVRPLFGLLATFVDAHILARASALFGNASMRGAIADFGVVFSGTEPDMRITVATNSGSMPVAQPMWSAIKVVTPFDGADTAASRWPRGSDNVKMSIALHPRTVLLAQPMRAVIKVVAIINGANTALPPFGSDNVKRSVAPHPRTVLLAHAVWSAIKVVATVNGANTTMRPFRFDGLKLPVALHAFEVRAAQVL